MKKDLAIATLSLIRTADERKVVFETVSELNNLGVSVVIVDEGSSIDDVKKLRTFNNVVVFEEKGLMNQLLLSQRETAKRADSIFYLHTDKLEFVKENARNLINAYLKQGPKGILIPARDETSINSYPSFQKKAEEFLNFFVSNFSALASLFPCPSLPVREVYATSLPRRL